MLKAFCLTLNRELSRTARCDLALTSSTVRTMALLLHSFRYNEPVLMVGETGVGKTSVAKVSLTIRWTE